MSLSGQVARFVSPAGEKYADNPAQAGAPLAPCSAGIPGTGLRAPACAGTAIGSHPRVSVFALARRLGGRVARVPMPSETSSVRVADRGRERGRYRTRLSENRTPRP